MAQRELPSPSESGHGRVLPLLQPKGAERLAQLDELAKSYGDRLAVIVVTREKNDAVISSLLGGNPSYRVGYDGDGSVFSAFSARYVPYSVIYDKRGRILWVGNPRRSPRQTSPTSSTKPRHEK